MSRISKLFTGLCIAALFMFILSAPVKADLAQAEAGLKAGQAALDAAYATGVKDAAWVQAQQAAGMAAGLAHQQDIANQAAAGMASGQAYLQAIAAKTAADAAWVQAQALAGMH